MVLYRTSVELYLKVEICPTGTEQRRELLIFIHGEIIVISVKYMYLTEPRRARSMRSHSKQKGLPKLIAICRARSSGFVMSISFKIFLSSRIISMAFNQVKNGEIFYRIPRRNDLKPDGTWPAILNLSSQRHMGWRKAAINCFDAAIGVLAWTHVTFYVYSLEEGWLYIDFTQQQ